jgi:hypothetical protein
MSRRRFIGGVILAIGLGATALPMAARAQVGMDETVRVRFLGLLVEHPDAPSLSLAWLDAHWRDELVPMALEIVRFIPQRSTAQALLALVARKTGESGPGKSWDEWMRWQWTRDPPPSSFAAFKAALYRESIRVSSAISRRRFRR